MQESAERPVELHMMLLLRQEAKSDCPGKRIVVLTMALTESHWGFKRH